MPALTSRNFKENDMYKVVDLVHRAIQIGLDVRKKTSEHCHVTINIGIN